MALANEENAERLMGMRIGTGRLASIVADRVEDLTSAVRLPLGPGLHDMKTYGFLSPHEDVVVRRAKKLERKRESTFSDRNHRLSWYYKRGEEGSIADWLLSSMA
jgi:hypothetical protein